MKTQQITEPQDSLTQEIFLRHILHLAPKDVNLKFVFDHIRNYAICGGMLWASVRVIGNAAAESNFLGRTYAVVAFAILFALPWALFSLNFLHGIVAAFSLQRSNKISMALYLLVCFAIFLAASKFMIVAKGA